MKGYALKHIFVILLIAVFCGVVSAESPHVNIPGTSSQVDSENVIQQLLAVERLKITKKENEIKDKEIEITILKDFTTYVRQLDALSRGLYDYQTPFREMLGTSSDEKIIQAVAQRTAEKDIYQIVVLQTALADSFMSDSVARNRSFTPSQFTITIGDKIYPVSFPGGTLAQLEAVIKKATDGKIDTRIVNDTPTTFVLALTASATGERNRMTFGGILTALYESGLLMQSVERVNEIKVAPNRIRSQNARSITADATKAIIKSGNNGQIDVLPDNIVIQNNTSFEFTLGVSINPPNIAQNNGTPAFPDLDIRLMEGIIISNITISGGRIIPFYQEQIVPQAVTSVSNFVNAVVLLFDDGTVKTVSVQSNGTYSIPLGLYTDKRVAKITLMNENTDREYTFSGIRFVTKVSEGGVQPKNPISRARDAIITVDGVRAVRDNNNIDDIINGVVLYLKKASPDEVTVTIDYNYEMVQKSVMDWVNAYNQVMEYLSILTTPNLDTTALHERAEENQRIGIYQAESSFISLKTKLRTVCMDPYPTDLGSELVTLEQIGIFTKRAGSFAAESADWQTTQMGLLQIDTTVLEKMLKDHFREVEQLFANDTDGDIVRDTGVAYRINQTLQLALGLTGFLDKKIKSNTDAIAKIKLEIQQLNDKIAAEEVDLRRRYGQMNQTINETQAQQRWLNSQFQNR